MAKRIRWIGVSVAVMAICAGAANSVRYPVYLFNVDMAGRWHVAIHDDLRRLPIQCGQ